MHKILPFFMDDRLVLVGVGGGIVCISALIMYNMKDYLNQPLHNSSYRPSYNSTYRPNYTQNYRPSYSQNYRPLSYTRKINYRKTF